MALEGTETIGAYTSEIKEYGVKEAFFYNLLRERILWNKAENKDIREGRYWVRESIKGWREFLPLREDELRAVIRNLHKKGAIILGQFNDKPGDRTMWISLADDEIAKIKE